MKKRMTRQEMVKELIDLEVSMFMDEDAIREILVEGFSGYNSCSDNLVAEKYFDIFGDIVEEDGFSGVELVVIVTH